MEKASTTISYIGGIFSIMAALTLTDWGIVLGMITAVGTFLINWHYKHREDSRQSEVHRARIERLVADRRRRDVESPYRRRSTDQDRHEEMVPPSAVSCSRQGGCRQDQK